MWKWNLRFSHQFSCMYASPKKKHDPKNWYRYLRSASTWEEVSVTRTPVLKNWYRCILWNFLKLFYHSVFMSCILSQIHQRVPDFKPQTLLDFGSGVGSVSWWGQFIGTIAFVYIRKIYTFSNFFNMVFFLCIIISDNSHCPLNWHWIVFCKNHWGWSLKFWSLYQIFYSVIVK